MSLARNYIIKEYTHELHARWSEEREVKIRNNSVLATSRSGHFFTVATIKSWVGDAKDPLLMFNNYENRCPEKAKEKEIALAREGVKVIIVRDLLNWASSLGKRTTIPQDVLNAWYQIAQEYIEPKVLPNFIRVHYDTFFESKKYRQTICKQVGGNYHEEGLDVVSGPGKGSSFDGFEFQGKGSQMNVLERYKLLDEDTLSLLKRNPGILTFYLKYWNPNSTKTEIINKLLQS